MQFAKLMGDDGRQVERPTAMEGSVSWSIAEGKTHAWAADSKTLLAELVGVFAWCGSVQPDCVSRASSRSMSTARAFERRPGS